MIWRMNEVSCFTEGNTSQKHFYCAMGELEEAMDALLQNPKTMRKLYVGAKMARGFGWLVINLFGSNVPSVFFVIFNP